MQAALKMVTTVLPGNRIEITAPELKEGECVEVILVLPASANGAGRYPSALITEYHALTNKKLHGEITESEGVRLQTIREEIAALDSQRPIPDVWDVQERKLRDELADIRAELEALPDAE